MDSGGPHHPEPDSVISDILRYRRPAVPVRIVWILVVYMGHDLKNSTSVVLNRINWCTSHLLTRRVIRLPSHPRRFSLPGNGIRAKCANAQPGVIGVYGGVRHSKEVRS